MQMQKMGTGDGHEILPETSTETYGADRKAFSGPLNKRGTRKSARFNIPDDVGSRSGSTRSRNTEDYVEITLDVGDDSVAVHSVKTAGGGDVEDPELTLLAKGLEKRGSLGTSVVRNASSRIRQVSEELRKLTSFSRRPVGGRYDRTKSGAVPALQGLKFISKANSAAAWAALEKRFDELTQKTNGLLPRASFGECIGMNKDSKEFAGELFDALSRRRNIQGDLINKEQLKDFWDQISDQSFDTRLQTFFDMVDKDADGRVSEEEVKEIISLSASANKLSNIQKQADEYAALIMEELDPDNLGYIMIESLETLTGFNAFWYTHHLFIIIYGMLIVHGIKLYLAKEWYKKTTWMYLAVPILLYACERLMRALRSNVKPVSILKVAVYPGNVLALHMSKPVVFKYKSGQDMFVNCKAVSSFEWGILMWSTSTSPRVETTCGRFHPQDSYQIRLP